MPRPRCSGWTTPQDRATSGSSSVTCAYPTIVPGAVDRHPGVGGEVAHPAPFPAHEVLAQHDLPAPVELVGDDHVGHRIEIVRRRRSQLVRGGIVHAGIVYATSVGRSAIA